MKISYAGRELLNVEVGGSFRIPSFSNEFERSQNINGRLLVKKRRTISTEFDLPLIIKNRYAKRSSDEIINSIVNYFDYDEPQPLQFEGRKWYWMARVEGPFEVKQTARGFEEITVRVILEDPYKYGEERSGSFPSELLTITNEGTAPTYPVFKATVKESITNLDIVTDQGYMRIGQPLSVEEAVFAPETLILRDTLSSLTGWTAANDVEGGIVAGQMHTDGESFRAQSYGQGANWHGPAVKKSLASTLQDFKIDVYCSLKTTEVSEAGRLEITLLDINNNPIGKVAMKDLRVTTDENTGEARAGALLGGHHLINTSGVRPGVWNHFYGIMRLQRQGTKWHAYIAKIDIHNGHRHNTVWQEVYVDVNERYMNQLAQVQIHIGQHGTKHWVRDIAVHEIRVWRLNQQQGIPYIAHAGDEIEIDHRTNDIRINGEDAKHLKDFGASFFALHKGDNIISYSSSGEVELSMEWRERFK
ncbi:phage distal tail protein [Bacillus sp. FJAT-45037]|uniref:phage distal tail protein n=1 Tax=Bacillus sp. FJAT-45037 TaxID=2011007 RepID=UPI0012FE1572|nr:phage tail domain-containing protein [Bacillus sp. FJAT-45037]